MALAACDRAAEVPLADGAAPPVPPVYCYVTIADDDCFATPQLGQEGRLIRPWPPALQRPAPPAPAVPAKAASGAP